MKSKTVKLILSLVVLGVLCGTYFGVQTYVKKQEENEEPDQEESTEEVFSVNADEIKSLKFLIDEDEVTFVKDEDTWYKEDEREFPVDQDILSNAASSISDINADRVLENVESTEEYDLDQPQNNITVTMEDGTENVIHVGMENDSSQYYLSINDETNKVYVVSSASVEPYQKSLYDYAEAGEFPVIDSSSITDISVERGDSSYDLVKNADTDLWYIEEGDGRDKADSSKISTLTGSIGSLTYGSFVDYNCTDESKYGFDDPYAVLKVKYQEEEEIEDTDAGEESSEEEENAEDTSESSAEESSDDETEESDTEEEPAVKLVDKEVVLYIGDESGDNRYVRVDNSNEIYTLAIGTINGLVGKDISEFWDLTVNYLSVNQLDSLKMQRADEDTHIVNVSRETSEDDEESTTAATLEYELDGEKLEETSAFTTFYNKLINLTGQERLTEPYTPDKEPDMQIEFKDVNGEITNLDFYEYDVNFFAAAVNETKVYLVNKMTYRELSDSYEKIFSEESADE